MRSSRVHPVQPRSSSSRSSPAMFDAIDLLTEVAAAREVSPGAVALAWLVHRDDVTAVISGPARTPPHVQIAGEAMRLGLDDEVAAALTERFRAAGAR